MKMRFIGTMLFALALSVALVGCAGSQQASTESSQGSQSGSSVAESQKPKPVELTNSYTTQFEKINHVTFPALTFDYPDGWAITEEDVQMDREYVCLTNEAGTKVYYAMLPKGNAGYNLKMQGFTANIAPIAPSSFVPSYVQGDDMSSLGSFSVMGVEILGSDKAAEAYCVLPDSSVGNDVSLAGPFDKALAFPYVMDIAFYAFAPDNTPLEGDEKKEVVAILSSFRCAGDVAIALDE